MTLSAILYRNKLSFAELICEICSPRKFCAVWYSIHYCGRYAIKITDDNLGDLFISNLSFCKDLCFVPFKIQ